MAEAKNSTKKTATVKNETKAENAIKVVEEIDEQKVAEQVVDSIKEEIKTIVPENKVDEAKVSEASIAIEEAKEVLENKDSVEKLLETKPENAEKIIEDEIKKATEVANKARKIIGTRNVEHSTFTTFWNGFGYDI